MEHEQAAQPAAGAEQVLPPERRSEAAAIDLEALDDSGGAPVVHVEYDEGMERPFAFHALPAWLGERIGRADILAANPHEGLALYCRSCDLLLNGTRTGGICPICGEAGRDRVFYLLAEPEDDA